MNVLMINFMMYFVYTILSFKKNWTLNIHNLISCWFTLIAFLGYLSVATGIYGQVYGEFVTFPIEPYIFAFIAFVIFMLPFKRFNVKDIELENFPRIDDEKINNIAKILIILFSLYFIVLFSAALHCLSYQGHEVYEAVHSDGVRLYKFNFIEEQIFGKIGLIYNSLSSLLLFYCLYSLILDKKGIYTKRNMLAICLIFACILCGNIAAGARGGIFFFAITVSIVIIPFYRYFPKRVKQKFNLLIMVLLGLFLVYSLAMTISRFEDSNVESPIESIFRYLGEPFPNLGSQFWDKVRMHPMGMRMYSTIMQNFFGIDSKAQSLGDSHVYWQWVTGVPVLVYKTIWGDFYFEFGIFVGSLVMGIYVLLLWLFLRKSQAINFFTIPILYYYIELATIGPMYFGKRDEYHTKVLILCMISCWIITKLLKNKNNGKEILHK